MSASTDKKSVATLIQFASLLTCKDNDNERQLDSDSLHETNLVRTSSWNENSLSDSLMDGKRYDAMRSFEFCQIAWSKIISLTVNGIVLMRMPEFGSTSDICSDFCHVSDFENVP